MSKKKYIQTAILIVVLVAACTFLAYLTIPHFNEKGITTLPYDIEEITAHSALIITGEYDNERVGADNIKSTQIVLFDEDDMVVETLVKEEGYDSETLLEEFDRIVEFEGLIYDVKISSTDTITYTSIFYKGKSKSYIKNYFSSYKDLQITELN